MWYIACLLRRAQQALQDAYAGGPKQLRGLCLLITPCRHQAHQQAVEEGTERGGAPLAARGPPVRGQRRAQQVQGYEDVPARGVQAALRQSARSHAALPVRVAHGVHHLTRAGQPWQAGKGL